MIKIFFEKTAKLIDSATNGAHSRTNCTGYTKNCQEREVVQEEWVQGSTVFGAEDAMRRLRSQGTQFGQRSAATLAPEGVSHKDEVNKKKPRAGRGF